jgi:hypothetical protein
MGTLLSTWRPAAGVALDRRQVIVFDAGGEKALSSPITSNALMTK